MYGAHWVHHFAKLIVLCLALGSFAAGALAADTPVDTTPAPVAMISTPGGAARIRPPDLRKITVDAGSPVVYKRITPRLGA